MTSTFSSCRLILGNEDFRTKTKDNAGGSVQFNEKFSFNKQEKENMLKVRRRGWCATARLMLYMGRVVSITPGAPGISCTAGTRISVQISVPIPCNALHDFI